MINDYGLCLSLEGLLANSKKIRSVCFGDYCKVSLSKMPCAKSKIFALNAIAFWNRNSILLFSETKVFQPARV